MQKRIEDELFRTDRQRGQKEWIEIARHLFNSFQAYLGQPINLEEPIEAGILEPSIGIRIRSGGPIGTALGMGWRAIIGYEPFDEGKVDIRVTMFLFSHGRRVGVHGDIGSFLVFRLDRIGSENQWVSLGWEEDELGEYESIQTDFPAAVWNLLSYMIEGQYNGRGRPDEYQDFIDEFRRLQFDPLSPVEKDGLKLRLKEELRPLLRGSDDELVRLFGDGTLHGLARPAHVREVFELIWRSFFGAEKI
jgi:hypothetical protein